ncbi:MAG: hypothetical protein IPF41_05380 [Flavobacteriales bacterium]|nr:hypothetical protein [Flavobacteriales bacterium]
MPRPKAQSATEQANALIADVRGGRALAHSLAYPVAERQVEGLLQQLQLLSDSLSSAAGEVERFSTGLNDPKGLAHALTQDTIVASDVRRSSPTWSKRGGGSSTRT